MEDFGYYCYFTMSCGGLNEDSGASKVTSQGKSGKYVLVLVQDPKRQSSKGQQGMNELKGRPEEHSSRKEARRPRRHEIVLLMLVAEVKRRTPLSP